MAAKKKVCSVEGCGRPHEAKGLCAPHYKRMNGAGNIRKNDPIRTRLKYEEGDICSVAACGRQCHARDLCVAHYNRLMHTGSCRASDPIITSDRTCSIDNCTRKHYGHGFCNLHYARWRRVGDPLSHGEVVRRQKSNQSLLEDGLKECYRCKKIKDLSEFYPRPKPKLLDCCKACCRSDRLERVYGLSVEDVNGLLKSQVYCCALCSSPFKLGEDRAYVVDHDHRTGDVRALLCIYCNASLGLFESRGLSPQFVQDYIDQKGHFENGRSYTGTEGNER